MGEDSRKLPSIIIYGKPKCGLCDRAKETIASVGLPFVFLNVEETLAAQTVPKNWQSSGLVELRAMWALCGDPIPFIVVDGRGFKSLADSLPAMGYAERRRALMRGQDAERSGDGPRRAGQDSGQVAPQH